MKGNESAWSGMNLRGGANCETPATLTSLIKSSVGDGTVAELDAILDDVRLVGKSVLCLGGEVG